MKWLVLASFLVCLAKFNEGGVLQYSRAKRNVTEKSSTEAEKEESFIQVSQEKESRDLEEAECLPGSEWESNCHYCRCSTSGIAECLKQNTCHLDTYLEPIRCKPNTTFLRDCNTCVCLENGMGLCTVAYCWRSSLPKKSDLLSGKECAPGTRWKSQCNQCSCSPDGYSFCTKQGCLGPETEPVLRCAPDSMWRNECNTCSCTSDGRALCTKIGCISDSEYANVNLEEETKQYGAHQTQLATKSSTNDTKSIVCQANRMFIKDCNTCWCNEEGTSYFCTRKICVPDLPDEVSPDEDKPKNVTLPRRVRSIQAQTPPKACQPRAEFRLDCNQCLCDSDGKEFSCTRYDCNKISNGGVRRKRGLAKEVATKCVPESVFDQGCNVCRCTKDGNHATCSLKRCSQDKSDNKSENDVDPANTDPSFRCNPGEQFKRMCNDCTCSADGRSIFCTLRLCDEDMTPSE